MADKIAAQLRTNVERLGARLSENLSEHSRDLGLVDSFASGSGGGAGKYLENGAVLTAQGIEETKKMLASKREVERTEGLKRVVAMMTKNLPVTSFFPLVTSLLSPTTPLQARSLISLYIVHCASRAPELALLSINAYQKDLSDPNPIVRAGAITTLSRMALDDVRELVGIAVAKGARDTSWYVRRASADAVRTLYLNDPTSDNRASLVPTLHVLLDAANPLTVGATLTAWEAVSPDSWDPIHHNYRRYCSILMDAEEWGQTVLLRTLLRYGRRFFLDPVAQGRLDPDAELALKHSAPLLNHLNPAVVSAVIKLHYYLSLPDRLAKIVKPLLRLLHSTSREVAQAALEDCALVVNERPDLFVDHLQTFFVKFSDSTESRRTRLKIMVRLVNASNIRVVLKELLTYVEDLDDSFASDAVTAIGTCANRVPSVAPECLETLISLLQSRHEPTIASSILVLRSLLLSPSLSLPSSTSRPAIISNLMSHLASGAIRDSTAKATVYWLVGQCAAEQDGQLVKGIGADVVRIGAKGFVDESIPAKLQLLTLSAKLVVVSHLASTTPHLRQLSLLFSYLTTLARYDQNYEVRDRSRFLAGLIESAGVGKRLGGDGGPSDEVGEAKMMLDEEAFRKGVQVEDLGGVERPEKQQGEGRDDEDGTRFRVEKVRRVLFDGKFFDAGFDRTTSSDSYLGTLSLVVASKRPTSHSASSSSSPLSTVAPYPTSVPPSSIRNAPSGPASHAGSRSATPTSSSTMQGFGSDSINGMRRIGSADFARGAVGGARDPGSKRDKVVLVPTQGGGGGGYGQTGAGFAKRPVQKLDDFLDDDDDDETEDEEEEEEEEDSDEEEEEDESEEEESEGDEEDESESSGEGDEDEDGEASSEHESRDRLVR